MPTLVQDPAWMARVEEMARRSEAISAQMNSPDVAVNGALVDSPELINSEPYGSWFYQLRPTDSAELDKLLDAAGYEQVASA